MAASFSTTIDTVRLERWGRKKSNPVTAGGPAVPPDTPGAMTTENKTCPRSSIKQCSLGKNGSGRTYDLYSVLPKQKPSAVVQAMAAQATDSYTAGLFQATCFAQVLRRPRQRLAPRIASQLCSFHSASASSQISATLLLLSFQTRGASTQLLQRQCLHLMGIWQRFSFLLQQAARVQIRAYACQLERALLHLFIVSLAPINIHLFSDLVLARRLPEFEAMLVRHGVW